MDASKDSNFILPRPVAAPEAILHTGLYTLGGTLGGRQPQAQGNLHNGRIGMFLAIWEVRDLGEP